MKMQLWFVFTVFACFDHSAFGLDVSYMCVCP